MTKEVVLPIEGGCQCGAMRYEITVAPLMVYACHCANCQRISGSAFALAAAITEASLGFTSGEPQRVGLRSDSGNERYGLFCGRCGCRIAHGQTPSNGILGLRAGTFDDRSWIDPTGHIWTRSAQPWFRFTPDDLLCETQPSDYTPFLERFKADVSFVDAAC